MIPHSDISASARILIVDDERLSRRLLEVMLAEEGFRFLSAASGEEALALVAQRPPDLIVLDVLMPGMDGYQVADTIKGSLATRDIPLIMISDVEDRNARMLGLSAGADAVLTRPVDRTELCGRVRNLLGLESHGDEHDGYSQMIEGEPGLRAGRLLESEHLFRSTFDGAPIGIVHESLDGQWLRVNQRLCDLLGYSREELRTLAVQEYMQSEGVAGDAESVRQMAAGTRDRHVIDEKRYRRRDGSFVWARVNMSVRRDAEARPQYFVSEIEEITERRTLEAQVRPATKSDPTGRRISGAAHDVDDPLTSPVVTAPVELAPETVLLVEDEPGVRRLSKRILEKAGYRVLEAVDGDAAEKLFAQHADAIDLVVTDVLMPGCGGPELLGRLHVRAPALKALYISGYTERSIAHEAGIDRDLPFVQKPFTAAEFVRRVREALDR